MTLGERIYCGVCLGCIAVLLYAIVARIDWLVLLGYFGWIVRVG